MHFTGIAAGPACGDGVVQEGEQCDDGNDVHGDGCTACMNDDSGSSGCCSSSSPDASAFGLFALVMGVLLVPSRWRRRAASSRHG